MSIPISCTARDAFSPAHTHRPTDGTGPPRRWNIRTVWSRAWHELRPVAFLRFLVNFYRDPLAWLALFASALILAYAGGAAMFWLHAIYLGEGGPAISPVAHWLLDSTAGFIGLTPAVALIIPFAVWASTIDDRMSPWVYGIVGGTLFGLATAPGPIVHDALVGRGTWIANQATQLVGNPGTVTAGTDIPHATSIMWQVAIGVPTYVVLTLVSLWAVRRLVRPRRPAPGV